MIKYKCPKCYRIAVLPNEMAYKFFICPACRWHSQVFGSFASYEPDDGRFGDKAREKIHSFLPAGAPKLRKIAVEQDSSAKMADVLVPHQNQQSQQTQQKQETAEELYELAEESPGKTKPLVTEHHQPSKISKSGYHGQKSLKQAHAKISIPPPPPYKQPKASKYAAAPPPPPIYPNRTGAQASWGHAKAKPMPSGAAGVFVFAMLSFIPCLGIVFGLIAIIAAGAMKKRIAENPNSYSGLGFIKAAQYLAIIGFILAWIVFFAMLQ